MKEIKQNSGFSLIELVLSLAILAILTSAIIVVLAYVNKVTVSKVRKLEAVNYAQEGIEAILSLKQENFVGLDPGSSPGIYHLSIENNLWKLTEYPDENTIPIENGLKRSVHIKRILVEGDPPTVKMLEVKVKVAWVATLNKEDSIQIEQIISNWSKNLNAVSVQTNWCGIDPESIMSVNIEGNQVARDISITGNKILVSTGQNVSPGSNTFARFVHSGPSFSNSIYSKGYISKAIQAEGENLYIATDSNKEEVVIYNIGNVPFTKIGYFNATGCDCKIPIDINIKTANGLTVGYLLMSDSLVIFDATNPGLNNSVPFIDEYRLDYEVSSFFVRGNYAYIGFKDNPANQLIQVLDISDPFNIKPVVGGTMTSLSSEIETIKQITANSNGTRLYVLTDKLTSQNSDEFIIIDSTQKNNLSVIDSFDTTTTVTSDFEPTKFVLLNEDVAIIAGVVSDPLTMPTLIVIDGLSSDSPSSCQQVTGTDFFAVYDLDYRIDASIPASFLYLTTDDSSEFKIVRGEYTGVGPNDDPNQKPITRL